jgi:hypothetical protein
VMAIADGADEIGEPAARQCQPLHSAADFIDDVGKRIACGSRISAERVCQLRHHRIVGRADKGVFEDVHEGLLSGWELITKYQDSSFRLRFEIVPRETLQVGRVSWYTRLRRRIICINNNTQNCDQKRDVPLLQRCGTFGMFRAYISAEDRGRGTGGWISSCHGQCISSAPLHPQSAPCTKGTSK